MTHKAFQNIEPGGRGHFLLHFYAAVYRLIHYLHSLQAAGGMALEAVFARYPFLEGYFTQMLPYLPDNISWEDAWRWWEAEISAWERGCPAHMPLRALTDQCGFNFASRTALLLVGLVEADSRFGTIFAGLQEPLPYRRPVLELVERIMKDRSDFGQDDSGGACRPLLAAGLLEVVNREAPVSESSLRIPPILLEVLKGDVSSRPGSWCQYHPPEAFPAIRDLIFPEDFLSQLEQLPALLSSARAETIILRGMLGSERLHLLGAVARVLGLGVMAVECTPPLTDQHWNVLGPLSSLSGSMPVITCDLGPGETETIPPLPGYKGPLGIMAGAAGGLRGPWVEKAVTLQVPMLRLAQRQRYWQETFADYPVRNQAEITERFHLPGGYIRQVGATAMAQAVLNRREEVTITDVRQACRILNRQFLETLATHLEPEGSWHRLVVSEATALKLQDLERRCRHRERLLEYLGPGFGTGGNRGVRALFTGSSGTGKTLAAKIMAAELGMDLYRVDLGAVVNKYIGETEKNLHRVLSRAEELDVILLLDEGDALLGKRTEVKSANDRYANLETNYLLQRLENYQGIILVTTNAGENVDAAFQRRMDVVVNFIAPQSDERLSIWQLHLPGDHAVDQDYLDKIAVQCVMNGGQIRNAALHATLLALDQGPGTVSPWHLEEALRSEYRKAGAIFPLSANGSPKPGPGGMEAFVYSWGLERY